MLLIARRRGTASRIVPEPTSVSAAAPTPAPLDVAAQDKLLIDELVSRAFAGGAERLGVGVCSLLGTRAHRLPGWRWVDVDPPEVAHLRRHLMPERPGWTQVGGCLCSPSWIDAVRGATQRQPVLVMDDAVAAVRPDARLSLLDELSAAMPVGSELILALERAALPPERERSPSPVLELVAPGAMSSDSRGRMLEVAPTSLVS